MDDRKNICDAYRMADPNTEARMEALRRRLLRAVKVEGRITYKELSLALRQNPTFVQQFVTKRSPKRLYDEQVKTITQMLDERERPVLNGEPSAESATESQLRAALLAFGVDRSELLQVVRVIKTYVRGGKAEETPALEQTRPATHRREPERSR